MYVDEAELEFLKLIRNYLQLLKAKFIPEVSVDFHGFIVQVLLVFVAHLDVAVIEHGILNGVRIGRDGVQGASATWWRNVEVDTVVKGFVTEMFVH